MRRKLISLVVLMLVSLPLLSACWDQRELEQLALVLAIGIDKGKEDTYAVTVLIALPSQMAGAGNGGGSGAGGAENKPYLMLEVESSTIAGALSILNGSIDRRVSLIQTKVLFLSEELARISGMLVMDEFMRFREARRNITMVVTKERASEFLDQIDVKTAKEPSRYFEEFENSFGYTGLTPARSLIHDFVTHIHTRYMEPITFYASIRPEDHEPSEHADREDPFRAGRLPMRGLPNVEVVGAAAFLRDRMVGVLSGEEVRVVLMVQERFQHSLFVVEDPRDPEYSVSLALSRGRPIRVKIDLRGPNPRVSILVTLEGEIEAIQTLTDYTNPEIHDEIERAVEEKIISAMKQVIKKTQDWGSDVMGLGQHIVGQFPTVGEWEDYDWPKRYADSEFTIETRVKLRRFGLQLSPPLAD